MEHKKENKSSKAGNFILIIGLILATSAIFLFINNIPGLWAQLLAVISSAFLGAGATSWMTNHLLERQTEAEEDQKKNVEFYKSKLASCSKFVKTLWSADSKNDIEDSELYKKLRDEMFTNVIFYLKEDEIEELNNCLSKEIPQPRILYSRITRILIANNDIGKKEKRTLKKDWERAKENINKIVGEIKDYFSDKESNNRDDNRERIYTLWTTLTNKIEKLEMDVSKKAEIYDAPITTSVMENDSNRTVINESEENCEEDSKSHNKQFNQAWHFAMWGEQQLNALRNGVNELSLVEYGESWRTNLLKQVGENDIVFLFRRGGYGYVGAFKPLGYRIFEYEGDQLKETIHYYNENETRKNSTKNITKDNCDIENYDIYGGLKEGADICANLIVEHVEPKAYIENGVGNPGGVYRRTISRYDAGYAATLLEWFKKEKNSVQNTSIEN